MYLLGILVGLFPDIDSIIYSPTNPLLHITYHRHFTHSFVMMPLLSALIVFIWHRKLIPWKEFLKYWFIVMAGYASHILLDLCTSYGTQAVWPVNNDRFAWDFVSIIDPLVTFPALFFLILGIKLKKRWLSGLATIWVCFYVGIGSYQHYRAEQLQRELSVVRGDHMEKHRVMPTLANLIVWRSLYLSENIMRADGIRLPLFGSATYKKGKRYDHLNRAEFDKYLMTVPTGDLERFNEAYETFNWFADGYLGVIDKNPFIMGDMRYSLVTNKFKPIWGIGLIPNSPDPVVWERYTEGRRERLDEFKKEVFEGPGYQTLSK